MRPGIMLDVHQSDGKHGIQEPYAGAGAVGADQFIVHVPELNVIL